MLEECYLVKFMSLEVGLVWYLAGYGVVSGWFGMVNVWFGVIPRFPAKSTGRRIITFDVTYGRKNNVISQVMAYPKVDRFNKNC